MLASAAFFLTHRFSAYRTGKDVNKISKYVAEKNYV